MTTSLLTSLMRLGAAVFGSNEDLSPIQDDSDDSESSDDESSDDESDSDSSDDTDGDTDGDDESGKSKGSGDKSDSEDEDADGDADGDSDGDESDDADGDADGDSEDADGDDSDSEAKDNDGKTDDSDSGDPKADVDPDSDKDAGGNHDSGEFAEAMIDGLQSGEDHGLKDNNSALQEATDNCREEDDCGADEAVWRPYDASQDVVSKPKGSKTDADAMQREARIITAAFRTQFRRRFLQARDTQVRHGVRRGRDLSERRLVESFVEIKSGVLPSRPDYKVETKDDVSLALAVVVDQSGSMHGREQHAAAVSMLALAESFDSLGAPVMCCGPRNGGRGTHAARDTYREDYYADGNRPEGGYHRTGMVRIDLFKDWNESFKHTKARYAAVQACGSTPLSDGIQFALQELNTRPERHRIVVVLTDGCPDSPGVVRRQIRLAKEAGITVIGVGIAGAEYYVPGLFPDHHIVVQDLIELPKRMMEVVGAIVFPKAVKRAALDGTLGTAKQRRRA